MGLWATGALGQGRVASSSVHAAALCVHTAAFCPRGRRIKCIVYGLLENTSLVHLGLAGTKITAVGARQLCQARTQQGCGGCMLLHSRKLTVCGPEACCGSDAALRPLPLRCCRACPGTTPLLSWT